MEFHLCYYNNCYVNIIILLYHFPAALLPTAHISPSDDSSTSEREGTLCKHPHLHVHVYTCLTLLASFFLPSHLSFKNMYTISISCTLFMYVYNSLYMCMVIIMISEHVYSVYV